MYREEEFSRLEINLPACLENYRYFRSKLSDTTKLLVLVKANAYGHGVDIVAPVLQDAGADCFAVSNIEEEVSTFIKVFEEKYGGHIKEDTNKLGYISNGYISEYKELFALKYTIRRYSDNKPIGEIRISVAPYSINSRGGYIEITYRDYAAAKTAISEYNNIMNDIL